MNRGTITVIVLLLLTLVQCGIAQNAYQIPFASAGNTIELTLVNTAITPLAGVKVVVTEVPAWLKFATSEQKIPLLKPEQESVAAFMFIVDKSAPVQKSHTLKFVISAPTGESWTKEIAVAVAAPERFELFQNFPNPFNPTTAISYQLPASSGAEGSAISRVNLRIYNMLGQEVALLVDDDRAAGYHQETWNAAGYASGVYVYQLIATDGGGQRQIARRRMMVLK